MCLWERIIELWSEYCLVRWVRKGSMKTSSHDWFRSILSSLAETYLLPWPLFAHVKGLPLKPMFRKPELQMNWWKSLAEEAGNLALLHLLSRDKIALKSPITPHGIEVGMEVDRVDLPWRRLQGACTAVMRKRMREEGVATERVGIYFEQHDHHKRKYICYCSFSKV